MPHPESLRIIPLALFGVFFLIGVLKRPVFFPISYLTLWQTKLANYYPFITQLKIELIVALAGLLFVFIKTSGRTGTVYKNLVHKYLLWLLGCMFISFLVAWDKEYSWNVKIYDFTKVIILYWMLILSLEKERDVNLFIWFWVLFYVYLCYEPIYDFINGSGGHTEMYGQTYLSDSGLLAGHVALANNMNQMIPLAFFLFLGAKEKLLKSLACIALTVFIIALIGSKSRGGAVGFIVLGLIIVYFSEKKLRNAFIVLIVGGLVFLNSGDMGATLGRIDSTSAHGRFTGLTNGLEMIVKGNILGVGPGCYLIARSYYFGYYMESHNIYGQVMGDLGIPGTIVAFLFIRQIFRYLIIGRNQIQPGDKDKVILRYMITGLITSLAIRLFISMGSHGLYFYYYYVIAALTVAIVRISGIDHAHRGMMKKNESCVSNGGATSP